MKWKRSCLYKGGKFVDGDGKPNEQIRNAVRDRFAELDGEPITLEINPCKETTSDKQRRYYFKIVVPAFIKHFAERKESPLRFDTDTMHDQMMRAVGGFSNPYVNAFTGEPDAGRISYNKLTTAQCEGYHTLCRKWAAENKFNVPEPNENENYY
jgi:hypothetical protein